MANVCDIREELFKNNEPRRLILQTPTTHLSAEDYTTSVNALINTIFPSWPSDPLILFLAMEIWGDRAFLAIDINNREYNFDTAHKTTIVLPVYVLRLHRKRWALVRWPREDQPVAERLAYLHNANGWKATPFVEDHNWRVVHESPREMQSLSDK